MDKKPKEKASKVITDPNTADALDGLSDHELDGLEKALIEELREAGIDEADLEALIAGNLRDFG